MTHRNASLTPRGRRQLAHLVVDEGWSYRRAAERFQVAPATARKWVSGIVPVHRWRTRVPDPAPVPPGHRQPSKTRSSICGSGARLPIGLAMRFRSAVHR